MAEGKGSSVTISQRRSLDRPCLLEDKRGSESGTPGESDVGFLPVNHKRKRALSLSSGDWHIKTRSAKRPSTDHRTRKPDECLPSAITKKCLNGIRNTKKVVQPTLLPKPKKITREAAIQPDVLLDHYRRSNDPILPIEETSGNTTKTVQPDQELPGQVRRALSPSANSHQGLRMASVLSDFQGTPRTFQRAFGSAPTEDRPHRANNDAPRRNMHQSIAGSDGSSAHHQKRQQVERSDTSGQVEGTAVSHVYQNQAEARDSAQPKQTILPTPNEGDEPRKGQSLLNEGSLGSGSGQSTEEVTNLKESSKTQTCETGFANTTRASNDRPVLEPSNSNPHKQAATDLEVPQSPESNHSFPSKEIKAQPSVSNIQLRFNVIKARHPRLNKIMWVGGGLSHRTAAGLFDEISRIVGKPSIERIHFKLSTSQGDHEAIITCADESAFCAMRDGFKEEIGRDLDETGNVIFNFSLEPDPGDSMGTVSGQQRNYDFDI